MNNVGIVPVKDYVANVADETDLTELERLIRERRQTLADRANPPQDPMKAARDLCTA